MQIPWGFQLSSLFYGFFLQPSFPPGERDRYSLDQARRNSLPFFSLLCISCFHPVLPCFPKLCAKSLGDSTARTFLWVLRLLPFSSFSWVFPFSKTPLGVALISKTNLEIRAYRNPPCSPSLCPPPGWRNSLNLDCHPWSGASGKSFHPVNPLFSPACVFFSPMRQTYEGTP